MRDRILSLILALVLLVYTTVPAFGSTESEEREKGEAALGIEESGETPNADAHLEEQDEQTEDSESEEESGSDGTGADGIAPGESGSEPSVDGEQESEKTPSASGDPAPDLSEGVYPAPDSPDGDDPATVLPVIDDVPVAELSPESLSQVAIISADNAFPFDNPIISSLSITPNGIAISWGAIDGVNRYRLFYRTASVGWQKLADTSSTSYFWTGPKSGVYYSFTVRCLSDDGKSYTSDYDVGKSISYKPQMLSAPVLTSAVNTPHGVRVAWDAVDGAEKYRVFCQLNSGDWTEIGDTASTSYTWTNAKSGASYTFAVRCITADGSRFTSDLGSTMSITYTPQLLATPMLYSVRNSAYGIAISWEAVEGAEKYRVFYKTDSTGWTRIADTIATDYTWTGAQSGTYYSFTVRCVTADGKAYTSDYDLGMGIVYQPQLLATPVLSSASNSFNGVNISWEAVEDAEKYRVFYKTGSSNWKRITDTAATDYTWTDAERGTAYTFTVRCVSADDKAYTSGYDPQGVNITYTPKLLGTPVLTSATNEPDGVAISWEAVEGAEKYRVYYKTGSSGWKSICDTTATSCLWSGAVFPNAYTFTVRCITADGSLHTSDYDHIGKSVNVKELGAPVLTSVSNFFNGISISWEAVNGAEKYRVFYKTDSTGWTRIADTTATGYTWTGAARDVAYAFTVRCISADGKTYTSGYDPQGLSIAYTPRLLETPMLASATNELDGAVISWEAVEGAEKYRVFYKTGSSNWKRLADTTSTRYTWADAVFPNAYTFTVRCITADGSMYTSDYDHVGKTINIKKLDTPKMTSAAISNGAKGISLKWKAVNGAQAYRVFYKTGSSGWIKLGDTTNTSIGWQDVEPDTIYTFTVRCISADGKTYTSDYETGATVHTPAASTPTLTVVTNTVNGIYISWGAVLHTQKYRVFYKTESTGWKKLADTSSTSYVWTGAEIDVNYTFTVRCLSDDGKSYTSRYDKTGKSITYEPQYLDSPVISSVTNDFDGINLSWGAIRGAEKYRVYYKTGSSAWKKIDDTTSASYKWTGAKSGTHYTFTVRCISADGKTYTSGYDSGKSITYWPKQPSVPRLYSVSNTFDGVTVSWGAVDGAKKYRVFYRTNSSDWKRLADTASTNYTWTGSTSGVKYAFTVRCISADGKAYTSGYDPQGLSIIYTPKKLSSPTLTSAIATQSGIKISWNAVGGAVKYRVFYKTGSGKWTKIADTSATYFTWTGAKRNTDYSFTVRCISDDGGMYTSGYDPEGISIKFW